MYHSFVSAWQQNDNTGNVSLKCGDTTTDGLSAVLRAAAQRLLAGEVAVLDAAWHRRWQRRTTTPGECFKVAVMARYLSDATEDTVQVNILAGGHQRIGIRSRSSGGCGGRAPRKWLDHGVRYARGAAPTSQCSTFF